MKRPVGRPKVHTEPVERHNVYLPVRVAKAAKKAGAGNLSKGIASAFTKEAQRGRQHRLVEVTDLAEIEAIKMGQGDFDDAMPSTALSLPVGGLIGGVWYAEAESLRKWRKVKE